MVKAGALWLALLVATAACKRDNDEARPAPLDVPPAIGSATTSPSSGVPGGARASSPAIEGSVGSFAAAEAEPDGTGTASTSEADGAAGNATKAPAADGAAPIMGLRTALHVARTSRGPLVNDYYLKAVTETANRVFRTAGFCLETDRKRYELPADVLDVKVPRDYPRLRARGKKGALDVFIIEGIHDAKLERQLSGKYRELKRYSDRALILVARGRGDAATMGHETGHYLGLGHHDDKRNLMFAMDGPLRTHFDPPQRTQLTAELEALRAKGTLKIIERPRCAVRVQLESPRRIRSGHRLLYMAVEHFSDGVVYRGEYLVDKPHGRGTATFPDGTRYEGEFRNGRRWGKGEQRYPDGARYEGQMRMGKRHGKGSMHYASGVRFDGTFKKGMAVRGVVVRDGVRYRAIVDDGKVKRGPRIGPR